MTGKSAFQVARLLALCILVSLIALPAAGVPKDRSGTQPAKFFNHVSSGVATRYFVAHPDQAPADLQARFREVAGAISNSTTVTSAAHTPAGDVFNRDGTGLPQNEESVSVCKKRNNVVLGGTNDYRGLLDPMENFTGWHLSTNGGDSVAAEGLLPPVRIAGKPTPSGGDPVDVLGDSCAAFAASLNYDPIDPFGKPNGIGLYRSNVRTLKRCPGGSSPACWPTRRAVAVAPPGHFFDKEWFDKDTSGSAGEVIWTAFADFAIDDNAPLGFTSARIRAVRCKADLSTCTKPILISGDDLDTQFADVTIGRDGRTYITWSEVRGELEGTPQTFIHKMRVAPPGSTNFGPERIIYRERKAIPFGGFLHANDFRIATYPKNEVAIINGRPRVFVVWDACTARVLDTICEEARVKLSYSNNLGRTWTRPKTVSNGGENYFPAIVRDPGKNRLAITYFSNQADPIFHNRQDVELVTVGMRGGVTNRQRITRPSNESEADPILGGSFIGDYIETDVRRGTAYVHFNANYRSIRLLGLGLPVPQQDNYLSKARL